MSQLRTSPASVEIGPHETFTLGIDVALSLKATETVSAGGPPSAILYDDTNGAVDVSATNLVSSAPGVIGTVVFPVLRALVLGNLYRLIVIIHPNAVDYRETVTIIPCTE